MVFGRYTLVLFLCSTHPSPAIIFSDKFMVGQILQSVEEKEVDKSENATSKVKRGKVGVGVKLLCIVV